MTAERSVKVQRAPGGGGGWLAARFKCQYSQQLLQVSYKYLTVGGWGADVRKFIALFVSSLLCHREARSAVATHSTSSGQASGTAPAGRRLSSGWLRFMGFFVATLLRMTKGADGVTLSPSTCGYSQVRSHSTSCELAAAGSGQAGQASGRVRASLGLGT